MRNSTKHFVSHWLLPFLLLALLGGCSTGAPESNQSDPDQLATGKQVYDANCAACHGIKGEGQPDWRVPVNGVFPAPPHDSSGHTWHHPDSVLLEVIAQGGSLPNSTMPAYAEILTVGEREAVLAYIKTFWGKQERESQARGSH